LNLGYFVFSGKVSEKVLVLEDKTLPKTKTQHLDRSTNPGQGSTNPG